MISSLKNYRKLLIAALVVILAIASVVVLDFTKPYAVYAKSGKKVEDPYAVKAGGEELFLVKDEKTAEKVIEEVLNEYTPEGAQVVSVSVDKKLSTEDKSLKRSGEPPAVLTEKEAVNYILEQNSTEDPLFSVTIDAEIGSVEKIEAGTSYEDNAELYEGESEVKSEGTDGDQIVTNQVTCVNGKILSSQVVDTTVINESVDKIVYKGTKAKSKDTDSSSGGAVMGSGSGTDVVNFALQFVGNPYVYGGTSLTDGADCSGFVQSVYAHFGISLPRTVPYQAQCGKAVSYSDAQPGDLICFSGHIGIYVGGGKMVHASDYDTGIIVTSTSYSGTVVSVRRIIE